jgi:hypothetical protein
VELHIHFPNVFMVGGGITLLLGLSKMSSKYFLNA